MKNPTYVAELQKKLGAPSSETVESLRLLKAFLKLPSDQRSEFIELVGEENFVEDIFAALEIAKMHIARTAEKQRKEVE